nr:hypothetical protein [Pseudomonas aeruginosa]
MAQILAHELIEGRLIGAVRIFRALKSDIQSLNNQLVTGLEVLVEATMGKASFFHEVGDA